MSYDSKFACLPSGTDDHSSIVGSAPAEIRSTDIQTSSIGWQALKSVAVDWCFAVGFMALGALALFSVLQLTGGR